MRLKLGTLTVATAFAATATPAIAAPPANDAFADAQKVKIGREYSGVATEATAELGEPAHSRWGALHSVWFRYRASRSGPLTIDTGGSEYDTVLAVYTGRDVSQLRLVRADDDGSPSADLGSTVRFKTKRGRTYRIAVGGYNEYVGTGVYKLWLSDGGIKGKGVTMAVDPGQTVDSVRSHGLRLHVSARRRVPMAVKLRVSRRTADELGLDSRTIGRTAGPIDYGQSLQAVIPLTREARDALDGVASLRATVRLTLPKSTAPDKVLTTRVGL
jgi:hypothetical protein